MAACRILLQPARQLLRCFEDQRMLAPAGDGLHLGMALGADNHRQSPLLLRPQHNFMDSFDEGTRGIDNLHVLRPEALVDGAGNTMGADHHHAPRLRLLGLLELPHAFLGKMRRHMAVVNDGSQGCHLFSLRHGFFH